MLASIRSLSSPSAEYLWLFWSAGISDLAVVIIFLPTPFEKANRAVCSALADQVQSGEICLVDYAAMRCS